MKRWIAIAVAALVIIAGGWWYLRGRQPRRDAQKQPTTTVERGDLRVTVEATGELEPLTTVEVKSKTGGEIATMYVEAGDYVKKGDLIAQLDPTDLEDEVEQARASVDAAAAQVRQAQYSAEAQSEQTRTSVAEAQASLESARARLRQAQAQLEQTRENTEQEIAQAQARLRSARAQLAQAKAQEQAQPETVEAGIAQAEANLESAHQDLAQLEAGNRPEEIAQARAQVDEAQATLENAESELARQEQLLTQGYVSQQSVDDARRAYRTAQAQLTSARQAWELARQGPRQEEIERARAQVQQAEASVRSARVQRVEVDVTTRQREAAEASVEEAEAAVRVAQSGRRNVEVAEGEVETARRSVEQAEAALEQAKAGELTVAAGREQVSAAAADRRRSQAQFEDVQYNFENTTITAPRDGVILEKLVEEGTLIPAGTAALASGTGIVTIADITQMYVMADVDEVDISSVAVGQEVEVEVETIEDVTISGRVDKIYPQGTEEESVIYFPVRIVITESRPELRPGMTADVTIVTAQKDDVLLVPDSTIDHAHKPPTVLVMPERGGRPEQREVEVGVTNYEQTEIISGLQEGETIVLPSDGEDEQQGGRRGPFGGPPR